MKKPIAVVLFLLTVLLGCQLNSTTYTNRAKDQDVAKSILEKFYAGFKSGNYDELYPLFSATPYSNSAEQRKAKLKGMFEASARQLGALKYTKVISCTTKVVEGAKPSGEYLISFEAGHERYVTKENFRLNLEGDSVKITYFNVDPLKQL